MTSKSELQKQVGQTVTLRGVTEDDAACAVVMVDSGPDIYLVGLASWGDQRGKRVEIKGQLDFRQIGPGGPLVDGDGLATHGMVGKRFVMERATWTIEP